jgi:hypothetical protein
MDGLANETDGCTSDYEKAQKSYQLGHEVIRLRVQDVVVNDYVVFIELIH